MLNRYIGNKTNLLPNIMELVDEYCQPGDFVGDLFSGSLAVSLELKRCGYNVIANDVNLFSTMFGKAYLSNNRIPNTDLKTIVSLKFREKALESSYRAIELLRGTKGFNFLRDGAQTIKYSRLLAVLSYLESAGDVAIPKKYRNNFFYETYCENGKNSSFVSARGKKGKRRFFSPKNAKQIDTVMNHIRWWRCEGFISETLYAVLISAVVRAVEKISNTQGTYHDFPRDDYDSRALRAFEFEPPPFDTTLTGGQHIVGDAEDSLNFADRIPELDLLYLDPPYNFRQYTSYYFLPNILCKYADIDDLKDYFSKVEYVRGQNMVDDFDSTFCKKSTFIESLYELIVKAEARTVVLSYFNGRNHWNDFKSECNGEGARLLTELFTDSIFQKRSFRLIPVKRKNYQSYGGYQGKEIDEYFFVGNRNLKAKRAVA